MSRKKQAVNHQEQRLWKRIRKANGPRAIHAAMRAYLNSYSARLVAVQEVVSLGKYNLTNADVQLIAQNVDVWLPTDEEVILHPVEKPNQPEHFRFLLNFGPLNRARQILVRNALQAQWNIHPSQTVFNGGREKAIELVRKHYLHGFRHVFELDVYHCFRSFDKEKIATYLSLPERVVTTVLSGDHLNITLSKGYQRQISYTPDDEMLPLELFADMESDWGPVRSGLTEGSMVSPFAAELLLAWVLKNVPDGPWRIVNYADNYFCLCENEEAASALSFILQELLHRHPAGPLKAKMPMRLIPPGQAFEFLGYKLEPKNPTGLQPYWGPKTEKKANDLRKHAYQRLSDPSLSYAKKVREFKMIELKHLSFVNAFPSWTAGKNFHKEKMTKILKKTGLKL